ncbi:MAG TPA: serine hydroxymethyltransferase [Candidatus Saccharimonadia bacterium]|nr:serine hydroxymethyltransferase [Candidatus Saccharimonadia bacterium]
MGIETSFDSIQTVEDRVRGIKESLGSELRLIASANYAYPEVVEAIGGLATNVYAEGSVAMRYVGGSEGYDKVELETIEHAKWLFGGDYATVQPLSGALANYVVFQALLNPGDRVLAMDLNAGGHLTHGAPFNLSGKTYDFAHYGVGVDGYIDYDQVADIAKEVKPKLIIAGSSSYPRIIDVAAMKEIAEAHGSYLHFDAAHYAGLIAAGHYPSPMQNGADTVSFSTYKTIRGPRGGCVVGTGDVAKRLERTVFPGIQSGPNEASICGIGVALERSRTEEYREYIGATIDNARATAAALAERGYHVVTGGTDTHIVLIDLSKSDEAVQAVTGKDAEQKCAEVGVTVNKNLVDKDGRSAQVTSGIRLGLQAMTVRGMTSGDAEAIAGLVDGAIRETHGGRRQRLAAQVLAFCQTHPIPTTGDHFSLRAPTIRDLVSHYYPGVHVPDNCGSPVYLKQESKHPEGWLRAVSNN